LFIGISERTDASSHRTKKKLRTREGPTGKKIGGGNCGSRESVHGLEQPYGFNQSGYRTNNKRVTQAD
jgi:hypothetical protein